MRLLGDMRAYNFVVDVIHDLDQVQYRIRSIDFDQQCYEGRTRIYLPQFYKENLGYVHLAQGVIGPETADQYRNEERSLLRRSSHSFLRPPRPERRLMPAASSACSLARTRRWSIVIQTIRMATTAATST